MPVSGYSVGRDLTFSLRTATGTLTVSGITSYNPKPMITDLKHKGQDGTTTHGTIPDGWQITFKVDRDGPELDDFFAAAEDAYFNGVSLALATMVETIQEPGGSVSQYSYTNGSIKPDDAGTYAGDALVSQSFTVSASRRLKVS